MTPVLHARTDAERRYNRAHIRARNCVERLFGVWKNRFLCLRRGLRFCPKRCVNVIVATACLHNFAVEQNEPHVLSEEMEEGDESYSIEAGDRGNSARQRLIDTHFSH
jgi:hypothetical protein